MSKAKKLYSVRLNEDKMKQLLHKHSLDSTTDLLEMLIDTAIRQELTQPTRLKLPVSRIGGKDRIRNQIVALMPKHKTYVDVFGGSLAILFAKNESLVEVVNDKDENWTNLYKMLKKHPVEIRNRLDELPVSRQVFNQFQKEPIPKNDIDRVVRMIYMSKLAYNSDGRNNFTITKDKNQARRLRKIQDELLFVSDRLKNVTIEQMDWTYILRNYAGKDTLFYVDSPYIIRGKRKGLYELGFTQRDNKELADRIHQTEGAFMVSHSQNKLFDKWYADFNKHEIVAVKASGKEVEGKKPKVVEVVYTNF